MNTRQYDMQELRKDWATADPEKRQYIERAAHNIANESGRIKNMREALVKAHRSGNLAEIKDIHDFVRNKREYRNE
jgi:hypothetical protein